MSLWTALVILAALLACGEQTPAPGGAVATVPASAETATSAPSPTTQEAEPTKTPQAVPTATPGPGAATTPLPANPQAPEAQTTPTPKQVTPGKPGTTPTHILANQGPRPAFTSVRYPTTRPSSGGNAGPREYHSTGKDTSTDFPPETNRRTQSKIRANPQGV